MQIFQVLEIREYPYFLTVEVSEGEYVKDVITELKDREVFLLVDHDTKRIWTYMGPISPLKLQIYGAILAGMLRKQLRLFYRIYPLNRYTKDDKEFQEILNKPLLDGRAKTIDKKDFPKEGFTENIGDITIHYPKVNNALEAIKSYPNPLSYDRIFLLIRNTIYTEEEEIESLLTDQKLSKKLVKLGQLNDGFTFFDDRNYSIRFIVERNTIQGLELYVPENDNIPIIKLKTSIIKEEKFEKVGNMQELIEAFQIPDGIEDEEIIVHELKDLDKNDTLN